MKPAFLAGAAALAVAASLALSAVHTTADQPPPAVEVADDQPAFDAGPEGTVRLGNPACPVSGGAVRGNIGVAHNGWWIGLAGNEHRAAFSRDVARYTTVLRDATGVDIAKPPRELIRRANRHFDAGPDGTRRLGNATCPVMGGAVDPDVGVAHNGWWIGLCCAGCADKLKTDTDAVAGKLLAATGVDIRKTPASYEALPDAPFEAGPDGTVKLGNAVCPMMGKPAKPDVGFMFNGWWIGVCCPPCERKFRNDTAKFAPMLLAETGIDVRRSPLSYMRRPAAAEKR